MTDDRRTRKTRREIRAAMLQCLKTTSLDKVTVKDICDIADINRSTFYTYYADPLELYDIMEREMVESLTVYVEKLKMNITSYKDFLHEIVKYISENADAYRAFIATNSVSFKKLNIEFLTKYNMWSISGSDADELYSEEFLVSGIFGLVSKWLCEGKKQSEEFIADLIYKLTVNIGKDK